MSHTLWIMATFEATIHTYSLSQCSTPYLGYGQGSAVSVNGFKIFDKFPHVIKTILYLL